MRSEKSLRLLDLNRDLPTTVDDVYALREGRRKRIQDLKSYLKFLSCLPKPSEHALSGKKGPSGSKPFKL
jgi:hypothetical protein